MLIGAVIGLVGWALVAGWMLWQARGDLQSGSDRLRSVRAEGSVAGVLEDDLAADLTAAEGAFRSARTTLHGPLLAPVRVLPWAGAQVRAAGRLASTGAEGAVVARRAVDDLQAAADGPQAGGPERLATLAELEAVAGRAVEGLESLDAGSSSGLVGPLASAVERVEEQRAAAIDAATDLRRVSAALGDLLAGPEPYLLLGGNNAEMRHGSGMYLSATELSFDQGSLELGDVQPTAELVLPEATVPVEGDLAENWPWLDHGRDLRTLGFTASFPQSAAIAVRTWEATGVGNPTAGVIAIDVDGVRGLLRAVGPVEVDGIRYTSDTVRGELLREQYLRFSDDRAERRDQLGEVARAVFERVEAGEFELPDLATELVDAVAGRHLMIWSTDPERQAAWDDVGASGRLGERSLAVGLVNRGGNKLDSWIGTEVLVDLADGRVEVVLGVQNDGPRQGPPYVVGPNVDGLEAGGHRAIVVVNLPAGTTEVEIEGARQVLLGGDGDTVVVAGELDVSPGGEAQVVVRGVLAEGVRSVVLEPTARIPRTEWSVAGQPFDTDRRRTVAVGP
jgi:hypothetical protein